MIYQSEAAECGLACLAMITAFYGSRLDLIQLRRRFEVSLHGMTLVELLNIAKEIGLSGRPVRIDLKGVAALRRPCLLHWDMNHFVVLVKTKGNKYTIHDPAVGKRIVSLETLSRSFTGIALELQFVHDFSPQKKRKSTSIWKLWTGGHHIVGRLWQLVFVSTFLELGVFIAPLFLQIITDHVVISRDLVLLDVLSVAILCFVLMQSIVGAMREWMTTSLRLNLNYLVSNDLLFHLSRLPLRYFQSRHLGDIHSRFNSLSVIQSRLSSDFIISMFDAAVGSITLFVMFFYSTTLSVVNILAVLAYWLVRILMHSPVMVRHEDFLVQQAKRDTLFLEGLRGIQAIKIFGQESNRANLFRQASAWQYIAEAEVNKWTIWFRLAGGAIGTTASIVTIWYGTRLVIGGEITLGMLLAFIFYRTTFASRSNGLIDRFMEIRMLNLHAYRIEDITTEPTEAERMFISDKITLDGSIALESITFRYNANEIDVLEDLSLLIEAGESVAIIGPSGCGKTTLLKIILGLIEPCEGTVRVGSATLGQQARLPAGFITAVMQDDTLFAGSIAENITFFDIRPDSRRMRECAKVACIDEHILSMPMQYESLVGDLGSSLSGGQKQRLLIARALYQTPRIIVFDEATSQLDLVTERHVLNNIKNLRITRIHASHRPETSKLADRTVMLDQKRIVERITGEIPA